MPACDWHVPAGGWRAAYFMLVTMLSVGYGDITPHTTPEIIVTMFALIAGIIFFGILLGSIAEALNVSAPPDSMCLSPSLHTAHLMRRPRQHCFWVLQLEGVTDTEGTTVWDCTSCR